MKREHPFTMKKLNNSKEGVGEAVAPQTGRLSSEHPHTSTSPKANTLVNELERLSNRELLELQLEVCKKIKLPEDRAAALEALLEVALNMVEDLGGGEYVEATNYIKRGSMLILRSALDKDDPESWFSLWREKYNTEPPVWFTDKIHESLTGKR